MPVRTPWHGLGNRPGGSRPLRLVQPPAKKPELDWGRGTGPARHSRYPGQGGQPGCAALERTARFSAYGRALATILFRTRKRLSGFSRSLTQRKRRLHTAGSLRGMEKSGLGSRQAQTRDPLVIAAGDEIEKYILLSHSHDGSLAVRVGFTPIRVVCANTLNAWQRMVPTPAN